MNKNNRYKTLLEVLGHLKNKGFTHNFLLNGYGELVEGKDVFLFPSQIEIIEFHRFEGQINPAYISNLYAVQTCTGRKGTVVDAYGAEGMEAVCVWSWRFRSNFNINKTGESKTIGKKNKLLRHVPKKQE